MESNFTLLSIRLMNNSYAIYRSIFLYITRYRRVKHLLTNEKNIKLYYGGGANRQEQYVNVDLRWTPAVDILADLEWCSKYLQNSCGEVYMSHVLEHYGYPGKAMKKDDSTVLDALECALELLVSGGCLRISVPDFHSLANLYLNENQPLFPSLSGRICGEQNYPQNLHRCVFDRDFLILCLKPERNGFC